MCAFFMGDQNRLSFFFESGLTSAVSGAATTLGGLVQSHSIDANTNPFVIRTTGQASRNVFTIENGPLDFDSSFSYYPQDFKTLYFALGSVNSVSGTNMRHIMSEINSADYNGVTSGVLTPFISFSLEDAQISSTTSGNNFIRTVNGCFIDSWEFKIAEGELATVDVGYLAQNIVFSSGAFSSPVQSTLTPYMWQHFIVHIPSGTALDALTDFSLSLKNNIDRHHYINGSRVAGAFVPINRDYDVSVGIHGNSASYKTLYDSYFIPGSTFNMLVAGVISGTNRSISLTLSGCKLLDMEAPSELETLQKETLKIQPTSCSAIESGATYSYKAF